MPPQKLSPPFRLLDYSTDNLALALGNEFNTGAEITQSDFYKYAEDYFSSAYPASGVKTMVVETDFRSAAYLEEYARFYASGFASYSRYCKRIHFFSGAFTEETFNLALFEENATNKSVWEGYLGYIVVKPLPHGKVGETLLRPPQGEGVFQPVCRDYIFDLFGKSLTVSSLIFQQSDGVISSNAMTALWTALDGTSRRFGAPALSLIDIARLAYSAKYEPDKLSHLEGLESGALRKALAHSGMVVEYRDQLQPTGRINLVKGFIYAYLKMGLPVLIEIIGNQSGKRLVTIAGYKVSPDAPDKTDAAALWSDKVIHFYAHDDEGGPFSIVEMGTDAIRTRKSETQGDEEQATYMMVALHPSIKIAFEDIYYWITLLDPLFRAQFSDMLFVWDIYLTSGEAYKTEVRSGAIHTKRLQYKMLTRPTPDRIWVARASVDSMNVVEFIFDAGALLDSPAFCLAANSLDINFQLLFKDWLDDKAAREETLDYLQNDAFFETLFQEVQWAYRSIADICLRFIKIWAERNTTYGAALLENNRQAVLLTDRLQEVFKRHGASDLLARFEKNPASIDLQRKLELALEKEMERHPEDVLTLLNLLDESNKVFLVPKKEEKPHKIEKNAAWQPVSEAGLSPIDLFDLNNIDKTVEVVKSQIADLYLMLPNAGISTEGDIYNQIMILRKKWTALENLKSKIMEPSKDSSARYKNNFSE